MNIMDELNIKSTFMRSIVSKAIAKKLKKTFGYTTDIHLNDFSTTVIDGKAHLHLDIDATMDKDELMKLLKQIGLI